MVGFVDDVATAVVFAVAHSVVVIAMILVAVFFAAAVVAATAVSFLFLIMSVKPVKLPEPPSRPRRYPAGHCYEYCRCCS